MKVLHIINSLATGGAEKLLLETIPLYNQLGIPTDILLLNGEEYPFLKELKFNNCCTIYIMSNGSVYNPLLFIKIIPYLKNYDIVHVHLFPAQYFVVFAKWFSFSKVKLIFTEHSTSNRRRNIKLFRWIDTFVYQSYDVVVAITETVKNNIISHLHLKKNIVVIENGIDLNRIENAKPIDFFVETLKNKRFQLLLQVSSFQEPKNQLTVIKSLLFLPDTFHLLLAGEGIEKEKCIAYVNEQKLQNRVHFLGVRKDIPELLKTVDFVILSSKYEGLSLASIEGMASGVPFIASRVPGLENIVENYGVLFTQGDEKELADKIITLMEDENLYQNTASLCVARAKQFDIKIMVDKHVELYKQVYEA